MFSKKLVCVVMALFLLTAFLPVSGVLAQDNVDDDVIRVGYIPGDDMVENINNIGSEGYGYEILKKVEEVSDLRFEFVELEGSLFDGLDNGTVDVMGLYFDTPERREKYLYMDTPLNAVSAALMVRNEEEFPFANPQDIDKKTVATYEGNLANAYLDEFLAENNISVEYKVGDFSTYMQQDADLYLMYSSNNSTVDYTTVLNLVKRNTYLISNYGNEKMLSEINDAVMEIIINEGDYFEELSQKYYVGHFRAFHRNLTVDELEMLRSRPLTVAYEINHSPFTFQNSSGDPDGAVVDLMNTLVEMYGFEVIYLPYSTQDPSTYPEHSDLIISAIGDKETYMNEYTRTESYYHMQMIGMVPSEIAIASTTTEDIREASEKVGVIDYLNANFDVFKDNVENELVYFSSFYDLLDAYEKGDVDMAVFTESGITYANSFLNNMDNYTYSTDFILDYYFGIENSIADEYIPLFNVMLDNISNNEYEEILIANTSTFFYEDTLLDVILKNANFIVFIAVVVIMGIAFYGYKQQKSKKEEITLAYNTDVVTGLMALHMFDDKVGMVLKSALPSEYELISMDIDMFRTINSHYSTEKGTNTIKALANVLKNTFDAESSYVTRRTADQFLVLRKIGRGGTLKDIYITAILPAVRKIVGDKYNFSMSFGSVIIDDTTAKTSMLIGLADTARNKGKDSHKTTFIEFNEKMKKQYENKMNITFRMEQAMKDREFFVVYQPKIKFDTMMIGGAEALVRWKPKFGDTIFPDAFIPVFEENGFIATLDLYVLDEVCRFIRENQAIIDIPLISVNLSAKTVLEPNIVRRISDIVALHELTPKKIELEITESAMVAEEGEIFKKLRKLKQLGFGISIDDFGAGVSSLNRLSSLEADVLKLDKEFLRNKQQNVRDVLVIQNIIGLAKNLDMLVVAEGIETSMQSKWLKKIKCDYAQGYYFERPLDQQTFKDLLIANNKYTIEDEKK